jgi:general secretion pathway protein F
VPVFAYKGVTTAGKAARGFLDADSARGARAKLRKDGIFPTEVAEASASAAAEPGTSRRIQLPSFNRISSLDLALTTRQAATLLGSGIPLVEALTALSEQSENARLKSVLGGVRNRVNEGASLADAMDQADAFPSLYVSMIRAGEAGGALEQVLARLADYLESQVRLWNKVSSILIYPIVMALFAMLVVGVLVTVVLPQITELLESLDQPLPFYTRWIIAMSHFARDWWWAMALGFVAVLAGLRTAVRATAGRAAYDRLRLRLPVVGRVVRLVAISRFTRTLATLLAGGLPIVRALATARDVTGNVVLGELVTHMIEVGERSGQLEAMLGKVADTYEEQVETTVARLTALLEPLLILVMVGIVIVIILATLVPLLQVTSSLG